jgi:hypothetical protein
LPFYGGYKLVKGLIKKNNHENIPPKLALKKPHSNVRLFIFAPLFVERCNYNAMIEYVTIRKLKG